MKLHQMNSLSITNYFNRILMDSWSGSDYYDLSNVDDHSISIKIKLILDQYTIVNNLSLRKYNCGILCLFRNNVNQISHQ